VDAGFFSSARRLRLVPGRLVDRSRLRGYYIDFRPKVVGDAGWPPPWLREGYGYVKLAQLALGHFERYVADGDEASLEFARAACRHLIRTQQPAGADDEGGWRHDFPFTHRVELGIPWLSAMAQGQAASLLLRVHGETGEEELAEAALLATRPFRLPVERGGVTATIDGHLFAEEYPTVPASHVLNGGVFATWGVRDVAATLGDPDVVSLHEELRAGLAATAARFDTGTWSRYDLFPKPPVNVASSFYHQLHISQLEALHGLYGDEEFAAVGRRFVAYEQRPVLRAAAFTRKVVFRLVVPRHPVPRPATTPSSDRDTLKVSDSRPIRRS
jgi:hypothetical protein